MIHTAIIESNPVEKSLILSILSNNCPNLKIVGTAADVREGKKIINSYRPELVFLSLDLPAKDGFSFMEEFDIKEFDTICMTRFDKHAIRAIRYNAIDFLLKPLIEEEVIQAVNRAEKKITRDNNNMQTFEEAIPYLKKKGTNPSRLAIPDSTGYSFIDVKSIMRIECESYCCYLHLENNKAIRVNRTMKDFETMLTDQFCRVHQSHIVNMHYAKKYVKGVGGFIIMKDGKEVEVSRRKKDEVLLKMSMI